MVRIRRVFDDTVEQMNPYTAMGLSPPPPSQSVTNVYLLSVYELVLYLNKSTTRSQNFTWTFPLRRINSLCNSSPLVSRTSCYVLA